MKMSEQRVDREPIRQAIIEEAKYWDKTDTADMMAQEMEWFTFEWTEREDRCWCGNTQLSSAIGELPGRLEALVRESLVQEMPVVQPVPSSEPVLVSEERPPYGEEE